MREVFDFLLGLHGPVVYAVVLGLVFLEGAAFVGLVVPGETALLLGGVLASRGNLSLEVLLVGGGVAAALGDSVGYAMGHWVGPAVESSRAGRWIGPRRWARARGHVARKGVSSVFAARWVSFLRTLVPTIAGMTEMPYRRFVLANAAGAVTWAVTVTALGYAAGGSIARAESVLGRLTFGTLVVAAVAAVLLALHARRRRRPDQESGHALAAGPVDDEPACTR